MKNSAVMEEIFGKPINSFVRFFLRLLYLLNCVFDVLSSWAVALSLVIARLYRKDQLIFHSSPFLSHKPLSEYLRGSVKIRISLGEMGSSLMENHLFFPSLKTAVKNGADVEIVHGPRVDPKTNRIYVLAKAGKIKIFKTEKYTPHHFLLAEKEDGSTFVLDESVHNEVLWAKSPGGDFNETLRPRRTYYYFLDDPGNYYWKLLQTFEERKSRALRESVNPRISVPQSYALFSYFVEFLYANFSRLFQPMLILISTNQRRGLNNIRGPQSKHLLVESTPSIREKASRPDKQGDFPFESDANDITQETLSKLVRKLSEENRTLKLELAKTKREIISSVSRLMYKSITVREDVTRKSLDIRLKHLQGSVEKLRDKFRQEGNQSISKKQLFQAVLTNILAVIGIAVAIVSLLLQLIHALSVRIQIK